MKTYKDTSNLANTIGSKQSGVDLPTRLPRVASGGIPPLLYQGCPNSDNQVEKNKTKLVKEPLKMGDKGYRKDDQTPSNKEYKIMKSLRENIKHWEKTDGVEHLFFLTLTFKENITDPKEAQRRFNNFNRQFNRISNIQWYYKGIEPQARGSIHFHIVGKSEIALGAKDYDWESHKKANEYRAKKSWGNMYKVQRKATASASDHLKTMWAKVRSIGEGSGFGRTEFLPIRSANSIGSYVGKYLGKCFQSQANNEWQKGLRRFSYSKKAPQVHGRIFSWRENKSKTSTALTWRQKLGAWAHGVGIKSNDWADLERKYGKLWAIEQRDHINYFGPMWFPFISSLRFGHSKPSCYPTGVIGNPLNYMGKDKSIEDPFETSESQLWENWLGDDTARSGMKEHANSVRKFQWAQENQRLHELIAK
jgi:hypothetical protein